MNKITDFFKNSLSAHGAENVLHVAKRQVRWLLAFGEHKDEYTSVTYITEFFENTFLGSPK